MRFAHIADCHIGGWREDKLKELSIKSFETAIDICLKRHVGFILISGDLFNTALPSIELIRDTAEILKNAKNHDVSVYIIPGSHDFSPSGKTMLDVLEKAGLVENVVKFKGDNLIFTEDKTGVKITGLYGKKGGLEINEYENIDLKDLEEERGFKIFMFHTALTEFKPADMEKMDSISYAKLPKNFNYYAGGHVHYIFDKREDKSLYVFPGALFPNNFKEIEEFKHGGFYIVDDQLNMEYVNVLLKDVKSYFFDANEKTPDEIKDEIINNIKEFEDKIITIRIEGILRSGKPNDVNFKDINDKLKEAYIVLKNTNKLTTKEFEEIEVKSGNVEDIEHGVIKETLEQVDFSLFDDDMTKRLMEVFDIEKNEDEKNFDFEKRVVKEGKKILGLE